MIEKLQEIINARAEKVFNDDIDPLMSSFYKLLDKAGSFYVEVTLNGTKTNIGTLGTFLKDAARKRNISAIVIAQTNEFVRQVAAAQTQIDELKEQFDQLTNQ